MVSPGLTFSTGGRTAKVCTPALGVNWWTSADAVPAARPITAASASVFMVMLNTP